MKKVNSLFDVIGPVMIGPSSSHTAGSAKLAKIARSIAGEEVKDVKFLLHGSFQTTYKGHGSDRALVAGMLGLDPHDVKLRTSFELAKERGLTYEFIPKDLGMVHPNTIKFIMTTVSGRVCEVMGSSVGGGEVVITDIDGFNVSFDGNYATIITEHNDIPGVVASVAGLLADKKINIANMNLFRTSKGKMASMIIEVDEVPEEHIMDLIRRLPGMMKVMVIEPIKVGELDV